MFLNKSSLHLCTLSESLHLPAMVPAHRPLAHVAQALGRQRAVALRKMWPRVATGLHREGPLPEECGFRLPLGSLHGNVSGSGCSDNGTRVGVKEGVLG